jgi:hypothetical protein
MAVVTEVVTEVVMEVVMAAVTEVVITEVVIMEAVIMVVAISVVTVSGTRMVAAGIAGCGSQPEPDMVARTSVRCGMRPCVPRISAMRSTRTPAPSATAV